MVDHEAFEQANSRANERLTQGPTATFARYDKRVQRVRTVASADARANPQRRASDTTANFAAVHREPGHEDVECPGL